MFYRFAHFVVGMLFRIIFGIRFKGRENVPEGGALICCNHRSLGDPVFIALALKVKDHPKFMAKAELFKFPPLRWLITSLGAFPVERGKSDMKAIRESMERLREGNKLLIFPEGHRVRQYIEGQAKTGVILLAVKCAKPVVPVLIERSRRFIGTRVTVIIGESYVIEKENEKSSQDFYREQAERLMKTVYGLGEVK